MTSGTPSTGAQSQSLAALTPLFSLCQRHRLPLSLLAIQFKIPGNPAGDAPRGLQRQLARAVERRVRHEDAQVLWQRGYLVLCLPGTPARGAVGLARRLREWCRQTRFTLEGRALQLTTAMAVHSAECGDTRSREPIRELLMDTLCLLAGDDEEQQPILSRRARRELDGDRPAPATADLDKQDPPRQFRHLVDTLSHHGEGILLRALSPALRRLDEPTRLRLIDHLLEASLMPTTPPATVER